MCFIHFKINSNYLRGGSFKCDKNLLHYMGWAGLDWAGLGWAGLGWAGLCYAGWIWMGWDGIACFFLSFVFEISTRNQYIVL